MMDIGRIINFMVRGHSSIQMVGYTEEIGYKIVWKVEGFLLGQQGSLMRGNTTRT